MRKFTDILTESKKIYQFHIGVAGELPENFEDKLEQSLKKFALENISAGKKTPIQERPLDFPQLKNMEVTYWEADVVYPTTPQVLQAYIGECCTIDQAYVIVRNMNDPREDYQENTDNEPYESLLNTEEMVSEDGQPMAGESRIMELLKELEKARGERDIDIADSAPAGDSKDIDMVENTKSVIGG